MNGVALRKHLLPQYLHNAGTLTFMLGVTPCPTRSPTNRPADGDGDGIWMANMKRCRWTASSILESLSVPLISALFIILAARVEFAAIAELGWGLALCWAF